MLPKKSARSSPPPNDDDARAALATKKGKVALAADHSPPPNPKTTDPQGEDLAAKQKQIAVSTEQEGEVHTTSSEDSEGPPPNPKSQPYQAKIWPDLTRNLPPVPPGFAAAAGLHHPFGMPPENDDEDLQPGLDLGINTEEQLLLKSLRMHNSNLQKQRDALAAKQQRSEAQTRVRLLIQQEKEHLQALEQEILHLQAQ